MRIAGMRLGAPVARLLSEILEDEVSETAGKIADAIARRVTVNVALTLEDYEAIAEVLAQDCPAPLYRLRTELLEELRTASPRHRRITGFTPHAAKRADSRPRHPSSRHSRAHRHEPPSSGFDLPDRFGRASRQLGERLWRVSQAVG